jgi:hypothetical protein
MGFKIFKKLKMEENDKLKLNLIPKDAWIKHYWELRATETINEENTEGSKGNETDKNREEMTEQVVGRVM